MKKGPPKDLNVELIPNVIRLKGILLLFTFKSAAEESKAFLSNIGN